MPYVFLSRPSSVLPCISRHAYAAQAFPRYHEQNPTDKKGWIKSGLEVENGTRAIGGENGTPPFFPSKIVNTFLPLFSNVKLKL